MKRFLVCALVAMGSLIFANVAQAQKMEAGGGLVLASNRPAFGIQGKVNYDLEFMMENLSASGALTLYFPSSSGSYDYGRWMLDFDGHYDFYHTNGFQFYGLGGLNITHYRKEPDESYLGGKDVGTTPGLNIGGGVTYHLQNGMVAFSEAKFIVNYYEQAAISFGVLWNL